MSNVEYAANCNKSKRDLFEEMDFTFTELTQLQIFEPKYIHHLWDSEETNQKKVQKSSKQSHTFLAIIAF